MLRAAVVTIFDRASAGVYQDVSGPTLVSILEHMGAHVVATHLLPDKPAQIEALLCRLADQQDVHLILTTGGTGPAARDHTPEATRAVIEHEMPAWRNCCAGTGTGAHRGRCLAGAGPSDRK